ncbi:ribbon-helix-helix domain-containing protein [Mesorhizobium sp.]|uniref:ribbon-helix-helix domain-containing protein n=1 Tax=Mesorhizobium sp. TaxID=1871066 RepID=UPI0025BFE6D5|nr:ribbon-helix-helix domain-containing protein [Mesorhizobium sp.]
MADGRRHDRQCRVFGAAGGELAVRDEIAESQGLTTPKFISTLYDEAIEINGQIANFVSMLRTTCALHLRGHRPAAQEQAALKQVTA